MIKRAALAIVLLMATLLIPDAGRAAFPGANGLIAFSNGSDIVTIAADGSDLTNLIGDGLDVTPAWSPDGKSIAFASDRSGQYALYTMRADGSDVTQISSSTYGDGWPTWSPDGKRIAFTRSFFTAGTGMFVMNADGSGATQITSGFIDLTPAWAPDGNEIAFARFLPDNSESIFAIHPDGSGLRRITHKAGVRDEAPNWSPDGSKIVFSRFGPPSITTGAYQVRADGTHTILLTQDVYGGMAVFSPDGARLAYTHAGTLLVSASDGKNPTVIGIGDKPDWQPDGATCSTGGLTGGPTLINSHQNELGIVSYRVHRKTEPALAAAPPLRSAVHEVNCDLVVTLEDVAGL